MLPNNQQVESLTGPAGPAPALPLSPDMPSTINSQIEPTGSPHLTSIDEALSLSIAFIASSTTSDQMTPAKAPTTPPISYELGLPIAANVPSQTLGQIEPIYTPVPAPMDISPDLPAEPNVPSTTRGQIAPVNAPLQAPINTAPAWPITSNVPSTTKCSIAPANAPLPVPITIASPLPIASNVTNAVRSQTTAANPPIVLQQNPASIRPQYLMIILPSALPRVMRAVECKSCKTKTQTDAYTYVDCSNPQCDRRICLLDNCFQAITRLRADDLVQHQYHQHLVNANLFQCYSCKAPKQRGRKDVETDTCSVCGVKWCLVGNYTYETPGPRIRRHITTKHRKS